jgi:hypothetical protein
MPGGKNLIVVDAQTGAISPLTTGPQTDILHTSAALTVKVDVAADGPPLSGQGGIMAVTNKPKRPLSTFVEAHHEEIIQEPATFAQTLMPPSAEMTVAELRDHAEELLTAIVLDMGVAQTPSEQSRKSQGFGAAQTMAPSGALHADARIQHGFSLRALVAEFRALRATVLRLYEESSQGDLGEVRRFNEAVDEALTVSLTRFAVRADLFRDQFIGIHSTTRRRSAGSTPITRSCSRRAGRVTSAHASRRGVYLRAGRHGDSMYFDSSLPHSYRRSGGRMCSAIVVTTG